MCCWGEVGGRNESAGPGWACGRDVREGQDAGVRARSVCGTTEMGRYGWERCKACGWGEVQGLLGGEVQGCDRGKRELWGGGLGPFYGAYGLMKGPPEAKEPLCEKAEGSFTPRNMCRARIFATVTKILSLLQHFFCKIKNKKKIKKNKIK